MTPYQEAAVLMAGILSMLAAEPGLGINSADVEMCLLRLRLASVAIGLSPAAALRAAEKGVFATVRIELARLAAADWLKGHDL